MQTTIQKQNNEETIWTPILPENEYQNEDELYLESTLNYETPSPLTNTSYNLTYDAAGNLNSGLNKNYTYDSFNQLTEIRNSTNNQLIARYSYDHEGNRIKQIEYYYTTGNNKTTYYVNDNFIQVRYTNGTILNETYYYANGKLIAKKDNSGAKTFYHGDHLGSTTLVTNQSGNIVEEEFYLPHGDVYSGSESSRFLFTSKELDKLTDLYYYGARYYQASVMRIFVQPDSIIPDIYNPQNLNRYSYVLNNPYRYIDPTGESTVDIHAIATYSALRELGYGRIDSIKLSLDSITPDIPLLRSYTETENHRFFHLASDISNEDMESILQQNAQKFSEAYEGGDKDAGRYLHVFGDTIHQGGPDYGTTKREHIRHYIFDFRRENIKITKNNIIKYLSTELKDKSPSKNDGLSANSYGQYSGPYGTTEDPGPDGVIYAYGSRPVSSSSGGGGCNKDMSCSK